MPMRDVAAFFRSTASSSVGINGIILVPLHIGPHVGRRHQAHSVAKRLELARPMMRRAAGLDTDQAPRQLLEECQDVATLQLASNDHMATSINAVDLKYRFGNVETDCRDRLHGSSSESWEPQQRPHLWHSRAGWRSRPQHQKETSPVLGVLFRRAGS